MRSFLMCSSHQIIFKVIKSRRTRWAGYVARIRLKRNKYRILGKYLRLYGRLILKYILKIG